MSEAQAAIRARRGTWRLIKGLSDRTPLRIKLITLLFALVGVALTVIGLVTVLVFSSYLQNQADNQLQNLYSSVMNEYSAQPGLGYEHRLLLQPGDIAEFISSSNGQVTQLTPGAPDNLPLPAIPTSQSWLNANQGQPVTVPAVSGSNDWRVIVVSASLSESALSQRQPGVLVVGVNLLNLHQTIGYLTRLDIIVSAVTLLVLVVVGIGVIRANLRPLNDIELTAGQIAAGHLNHRVPEGDPRTEIGSLGRSLNAMLAQIERAFRAQGEAEKSAHESEERMRRFIADAAHELRTPLTTIRGFAAHYRLRGGADRLRLEPPAPSAGAAPADEAGPVAGENPPAANRPDESVSFFSAPRKSADRDSQPENSSEASFGPVSSANGGVASERLSPEELDRLMSRVESEATRMGMLVEDLLTLARLDQQRPLNIAPVDLLTLAADAVQDARIVSPGRPIDLIVAPGTAFLIDGDEPRLRQVLANLVNNAITHTPAGTPVRVKIGRGTLDPGQVAGSSGADRQRRAGAAAGQDPWSAGTPAAEARKQPVPAVVIDVEDDGPGMTAEQARRVFERFYRADAARNRASGGTGLGLAIVAGLVSAHGGTVSVRTAPGRGADFQVKLPLSPDALAADDPDADEDFFA